MNCLYCQQYCSISHTGISPANSKIFTANCLSCYVSFSFFDSVETEIAIIAWTNLNKYFVKIYPGPTGNAPLFIVYYSKTLSDGTREWYDMIRFNFIPPDWTPQNAAEKIQSLKVFL